MLQSTPLDQEAESSFHTLQSFSFTSVSPEGSPSVNNVHRMRPQALLPRTHPKYRCGRCRASVKAGALPWLQILSKPPGKPPRGGLRSGSGPAPEAAPSLCLCHLLHRCLRVPLVLRFAMGKPDSGGGLHLGTVEPRGGGLPLWPMALQDPPSPASSGGTELRKEAQEVFTLSFSDTGAPRVSRLSCRGARSQDPEQVRRGVLLPGKPQPTSPFYRPTVS